MATKRPWWAGPVGSLTPREAAVFVIGLVLYLLLLVGGRAVVQEDDPDWQRWLLAGAAVVVSLAAIGVSFRSALRSREVDRVVVFEASTLAFFVTMLGALTYGLLEAFVDAPRLTAWTVWIYGMSAHAVSLIILRRRLF